MQIFIENKNMTERHLQEGQQQWVVTEKQKREKTFSSLYLIKNFPFLYHYLNIHKNFFDKASSMI